MPKVPKSKITQTRGPFPDLPSPFLTEGEQQEWRELKDGILCALQCPFSEFTDIAYLARKVFEDKGANAYRNKYSRSDA